MDERHKKLECAEVLYYFEKISEIPRGSGNEKAISDFLTDFANKNKFPVIQDSANNVIFKVPASRGAENAPAVIIQGHMDMVCEAEKGCSHDFSKDGIKLIYDGDELTADGTTLGGDDGIAVAMALAAAMDKDMVHPKLEIVLTTDEEVGMCGAAAIDCSVLEGKTLLNIDSEDEGIFIASCAGGVKTTSHIPFRETENRCERSYLLEISGLKGGHSGVDIDKGRANANKILGEILAPILEYVHISSVNGGAKDNAIPRNAEAVISFDSLLYDNVIGRINETAADIKLKYRESDPNIKIVISETEKRDKCFEKESAAAVVGFLNEVLYGINTMSDALPDLPESSNNIGVVRTADGVVDFLCAVRSSDADKKKEIKEDIIALSEKYGGTTDERGDYPAWEYDKNSYVRNLCEKIYKELCGKEPKTDIIHAGLECGLFAEKLPNVDMVSFGPDIYDIHTPNERISISSVERTWKFFKELLKKLAS